MLSYKMDFSFCSCKPGLSNPVTYDKSSTSVLKIHLQYIIRNYSYMYNMICVCSDVHTCRIV